MVKGASDSKNARCRLGPPPEGEDNKERHSGLWDFLPSFLSSLCPAKGQVTPSGAEGSEISSRRRLAKSLIRSQALSGYLAQRETYGLLSALHLGRGHKVNPILSACLFQRQCPSVFV